MSVLVQTVVTSGSEDEEEEDEEDEDDEELEEPRGLRKPMDFDHADPSWEPSEDVSKPSWEEESRGSWEGSTYTYST